jgi:hypothetical protein
MANHNPQLSKQASAPKGFWILMGVALLVGVTAILVGSTLQVNPSADDKRIFFVIGAGLLAVVLLLVAEVWRFLTTDRSPTV